MDCTALSAVLCCLAVCAIAVCETAQVSSIQAGPHCELVDVKAVHKGLWRGLRVLVDIHARGYAVVLGDGTLVKLLHHLSSIQVPAADLQHDVMMSMGQSSFDYHI